VCLLLFSDSAHTQQESVERKWETAMMIIITAARRVFVCEERCQGQQKELSLALLFCVERDCKARTKWHARRPPTTVQLFHSRPKLLNCAPLRLMIVTSPSGNNNVTGAWRVIVTMAIASFHLKVADLT
jgi:hypothetical protein